MMKPTACSTAFAHCYASGREDNSNEHTTCHIGTWCYHHIIHCWTSQVPFDQVKVMHSAGRQSVKNSCEHSKYTKPSHFIQFKYALPYLCHQGDLKVLHSTTGAQNFEHRLSTVERKLTNYLIIKFVYPKCGQGRWHVPGLVGM